MGFGYYHRGTTQEDSRVAPRVGLLVCLRRDVHVGHLVSTPALVLDSKWTLT